MSVETVVRTAIPPAAVYAKTATGRGELAARGLGLSRRQRSVLILLDGQRSCGALAAMMADGQVADIVAELLALDLIAPCAGAAVPVPASATAAAAVPPAATSYGDAGIAAIKAYMVQAARTHLGLLAAEVVERIERAGDAAQLRGVVGHWHMALQASKQGRETAAAHLERVRADLREAGIEA
jgi:hypothetical protein